MLVLEAADETEVDRRSAIVLRVAAFYFLGGWEQDCLISRAVNDEITGKIVIECAALN